MQRPYSILIGFCTALLALVFGFSGESRATSKGYDAPAKVILKDDIPCFFAEIDDDSPSPTGETLTVMINRGAKMWHIDEEHGQEALPFSVDRCIKYGTPWRSGVTIKEPEPLQYGVPYYADIEARGRFRVAFCLARDSNGGRLLTRWSEDGKQCTDKPLNDADRPSVWRRMFGK
ncbi:hypothetical protein BCF11_2133 [Collimonas sp. PA-H2]|uniref:hypothetical protein n=1 Tax=Collimonas sp. PA-H2 TaxID=1881062 RepID=UPI000BF67B88|nr:hypothetical protein [Collimonas sp. PA-H2]PFH09731.1 hypothetical protein BCF11_2133 [Collimonas sp. PA-H2]